ncbi:hypothetical protein D3C72_2134950 [compost metagenome]
MPFEIVAFRTLGAAAGQVEGDHVETRLEPGPQRGPCGLVGTEAVGKNGDLLALAAATTVEHFKTAHVRLPMALKGRILGHGGGRGLSRCELGFMCGSTAETASAGIRPWAG